MINELYTRENYRALATLLSRKWGWPEANERARVIVEATVCYPGVRDKSTGRYGIVRLQNHIDAIYFKREHEECE